MKVKFVLNQKGVEAINKNAGIAMEMAGEATKTDIISAQVMPFDQGYTQNKHTYMDRRDSKKGIVRIVTDVSYARRLYFHPEFDFQKANNPKARGEWFDPWIDGNKKEFAKNAYAAILRKLNGG